MDSKAFNNTILDFIEERQPETDREQFLAAMAENTDLLEMYEDYKTVEKLEQALGAEQYQPSASFDVKVMERIEALRPRRSSLLHFLSASRLAGAIATAGIAAFALRVSLDQEMSQSRVGKELKPSAPGMGSQETYGDLIVAFHNDIETSKEERKKMYPVLFNTSADSRENKQRVPGSFKKRVDRAEQSPREVESVADAERGQQDQIPMPNARDPEGGVTIVAMGFLDKTLGKGVAVQQQDRDELVSLDFKSPREPANTSAADSNRKALEEADLASKALVEAALTGNTIIYDRYKTAHMGSASQGAVAMANRSAKLSGLWGMLSSDAVRPVREGVRFTGNPSMFGRRMNDSQSPSTAEQYIAYDENPRIRPSDEAISTFGVDVDTASYTNTRRFLSSGQLPPPESVRIEEFLNYFSYSYPVEHEKPFGLSYEIAPSPLDPGRHLLRLALKSRDLGEATKPWNLVFLIDISSSMLDANKLPLVKAGLKSLVQKMRPQDRIAIVTYADEVAIRLPSASGAERESILNVIDSLQARGSTNGEGGIRSAYEIAQKNHIESGVNRVVLATDGDFNVGFSSHEQLIGLIEAQRKSGTSLTVLGVGTDNIHDGTLEQLADKGNGNYFYLDSLQEARSILETRVVATLEAVAADVKLQIEFNPAHVSEYRLIGYDNRRLENTQFKDDTADSGEMGSGHEVTALYELTLNGSSSAEVERRYAANAPMPAPAAFADELGFLKIRYKLPGSSQSQLMEFPLQHAAVKASAEQASEDFRFAAAVAYFGQRLRNGKFAGAYTFENIAQLAESGLGLDSERQRREFVNLVRTAGNAR